MNDTENILNIWIVDCIEFIGNNMCQESVRLILVEPSTFIFIL